MSFERDIDILYYYYCYADAKGISSDKEAMVSVISSELRKKLSDLKGFSCMDVEVEAHGFVSDPEEYISEEEALANSDESFYEFAIRVTGCQEGEASYSKYYPATYWEPAEGGWEFDYDEGASYDIGKLIERALSEIGFDGDCDIISDDSESWDSAIDSFIENERAEGYDAMYEREMEYKEIEMMMKMREAL